MLRVLILGPRGSGKGLLHNVLAASPDLPQPGSFQMQSAPAKRLRTADRYILVFRARAVDSIARHHWRTGMTTAESQQQVKEAWSQVNTHAAGAPVKWVYYRAMVCSLSLVIDDLARFLGVPPWTYNGEVFDGDLDYETTPETAPSGEMASHG